MSRIVELDPIVHKEDTILILGSMPSVISLEKQTYYANKSNRFWSMMGCIFDKEIRTDQDQSSILKEHHIALWDICHSYRIKRGLQSYRRHTNCDIWKERGCADKRKFRFFKRRKLYAYIYLSRETICYYFS